MTVLREKDASYFVCLCNQHCPEKHDTLFIEASTDMVAGDLRMVVVCLCSISLIGCDKNMLKTNSMDHVTEESLQQMRVTNSVSLLRFEIEEVINDALGQVGGQVVLS